MVLRNRSRVEILYDIVSAGKPFSKKTHLMYRANLSYQQLDLYLDFILRNGLMEEKFLDDEGRIYVMTKKGEDFVKLFDDMRILIKPVSQRGSEAELQSAKAADLEGSVEPISKVNTPQPPTSFNY